MRQARDSEIQKTDTPMVSVIVPVYNVEEYISDCICSILNQTYRNIEVILIDDKGDDGSISVAKGLLSGAGLLWKIIEHRSNRGLAAARNTGVAAAIGRYLYFLDSDDMLNSRTMELLVHEAEARNSDMTYGNYVNEQYGRLFDGYRTRAADAVVSQDAWYGLVHMQYSTMACNVLIRRDWYESTGVRFIEGMLHEDEAWSLLLVPFCNCVAYVNSITYYYRYRADSIMHSQSMNLKKVQSKMEILKISRQCANLCPGELKSDYSVLHNRWIADTLCSLCEISPVESAGLVKQVLKYLWVSDMRAIRNINMAELRWCYMFRLFLPDVVAYLIACKLVAKKILK